VLESRPQTILLYDASMIAAIIASAPIPEMSVIELFGRKTAEIAIATITSESRMIVELAADTNFRASDHM